MKLTLEEWTYITGLGAIAIALLRRGYRAVRKIETVFDFVSELRSNHLPHLYERLGEIENHMGIRRDDGRDKASDA